ncbi:hypothetical protein FHG87_015568, partial [Trinorchestia longiramus]
MGHQLSSNQIQPLEDRVEALKSAPLPKTKGELRSFLGTVEYYQQYIPNYSQLTSKLHDFLKKNSPEQIPWIDTTEDLFESL